MKEELRQEIIDEHKASLADAREKFEVALRDRAAYLGDGGDLYSSWIPKKVKTLKTAIQFLIGSCLIFILVAKGILEIAQTFHVIDNFNGFEISLFRGEELFNHILGISPFKYIASALAISAGVELSYMLFTDGPDETIEPLMLAIASAAFYTISNTPENSWAMLGYAISLLVLMVCLRLYKRWHL